MPSCHRQPTILYSIPSIGSRCSRSESGGVTSCYNQLMLSLDSHSLGYWTSPLGSALSSNLIVKPVPSLYWLLQLPLTLKILDSYHLCCVCDGLCPLYSRSLIQPLLLKSSTACSSMCLWSVSLGLSFHLSTLVLTCSLSFFLPSFTLSHLVPYTTPQVTCLPLLTLRNLDAISGSESSSKPPLPMTWSLESD